MTFSKIESYRDFIVREFQQRKKRNPAYSLGAYARDLGIPAPNLSQVLHGSKGFSLARARLIAAKINLQDEEKELFIHLVQAQHARSSSERKLALEKAHQVQLALEYSELEVERFKIISDWYHFAILELTELSEFQSDSAWIAQRLQLPTELVKAAVDRLFEFGLLQNREGRWSQSQEHLAVPTSNPSHVLREYHRQILAKAESAIENVSVDERDFSAVTISISEKTYPQAIQLLKEFRRNLAKILQEAPEKDRVYCLSLQFFPLDKKDSQPKPASSHGEEVST